MLGVGGIPGRLPLNVKSCLGVHSVQGVGLWYLDPHMEDMCSDILRISKGWASHKI